MGFERPCLLMRVKPSSVSLSDRGLGQANIKVVGSATPRLLFRDGRHFLPAAESMRAVKGQPSRVASAEESDLPEDVSSSQVA